MTRQSYLARDYISERLGSLKPKIAIVCGSGLGELSSALQNSQVIPFSELAGFPNLNVQGHCGELVLGSLGQTDVALLKGRKHFYEDMDSSFVKTYIRTLKLIGCSQLLVTNAAGGLSLEWSPGTMMLIKDHINLQPVNPLQGANEADFGPRFLPMDQCYDPFGIECFMEVSKNLGFELRKGVYTAVLGPSFETAAEIRAFASLGGDAVGMSTVAEVIVARHCGLKVNGISVITNWGTGLKPGKHDHQSVLDEAKHIGSKLILLVEAWCKKIGPTL